MSPTPLSARWAGAFKALLMGALVALVGPPERASAQLLEGGSVGIILQGNDFQCGLRSDAGTCAALDDSPTDPGGVWPTGSPNAYMFNSGIMVATIIGEGGGPWAGDTVGAYFFNASGPGIAAPITNIWNSLDPVDIANWPEAGDIPEFPFLSAYVTDEELYSDVLLGRAAASQQDSWLVYWDGDPGLQTGRPHPAGLLVEQRTHAWNYPAGNEGTLYFIYHITNVSNTEYFQRLNENRFFGGANELPDEGWTLDEVYMSYAADPDVTADARDNFASAILPFSMGIVWDSNFEASEFQYPPAIFHPPFFEDAPGIIGTKYLKSPLGIGLSLFSVYTNGGVFSDPSGSQQLHRYLSGNLRPELGDPECSVENPIERRLCYFNPAATDVRYFQSSGPFSIAPGETVTIVSAMFAAATVDVPGITQGEQNPPTVQNEPPAPSIHPGCFGHPITPIEQAAGWISTPDAACPEAEGEPGMDIFEVEVVDESLLAKAQVAQVIFDNKFLLPFAPEPPTFYVVPGDGQVTVVWEPSPSEETGDPFFQVAGDEESPLFNPNFRQFDVEGYRVYRSEDGVNFDLIAQFDKTGTVFTDALCETDPTFLAGVEECDEVREIDLTDRLVQYAPGDIVELSTGETIVLAADTAPPTRFPALSNTGVPFAYVDEDVRNGFEYYYRVTAFDINSLTSGPTSLESAALPAKNAIPRPEAGNLALAELGAVTMIGADGEPLNPAAGLPSIDAQTGIFSGPMPPTDAVTLSFAPVIERLMTAGALTAVIDSVQIFASSNRTSGTQELPSPECPVSFRGGLAASPFGACWAVHFTGTLPDGSAVQEVMRGYTPWWSAFGEFATVELSEAFTFPLSDEALEQFDIPAGTGGLAATMEFVVSEAINNSVAEGPQNRRFAAYAGGSRWFSGTENTYADPAALIRVGNLNEIDTVWAPVSYSPLPSGAETVQPFEKQCFERALAFLGRAADTRFTWGGGTFSEVMDVTHRVPVEFSPDVGPTWGFLVDDANGNGVIDWHDFNYIGTAHDLIQNVDGGDCDGVNGGRFNPTNPPVSLVQSVTSLQPTSTEGLAEAGYADLAQTGMGFGLFVNGGRYIMEMQSLPGEGTVWTLRTYFGAVYASTDAATLDPSGYTLDPSATHASETRPFLIPGLGFEFNVETSAGFVELTSADLENVRVTPDPYYGASLYDFSPAARNLRFMNLPPAASIRIYSVSGVLVDVINHEDPSGGSLATWDLRNRSGQMVASGVYFYHLSTPEGLEHTGKFTVIHSGLSR